MFFGRRKGNVHFRWKYMYDNKMHEVHFFFLFGMPKDVQDMHNVD